MMDTVKPSPPSDSELDLGDLDTTEYVYISTTVLMFVTSLSINLAMGCTLQPQDFKRQWNTLGGTFAGAVLQYLVFPPLVFLVSHLLGLPGPYSIGLALVASCPGNALTGLVTYYINGDVCLSFCLTAVCSAVSIGFAPAMLHLYSRSWTHESLHIALWPLASTLAFQTVPPIIGYLIKMRSAHAAWFIEKISTVIGLLSFIIDCLMQLVANHRQVMRTTWGVVFAVLLLPGLGWMLAYILARLFRQNIWKRRSICVEILLHNVSLAMVILGVTFHDFRSKLEVAAVLSLFNPVGGLYGLLVVVIYNLRAPWTKSGNGVFSRAQELRDLGENGAASISNSDADEDLKPRSAVEQEVDGAMGGAIDTWPLPMMRGPITVSTDTNHADARTKAPDSRLAIMLDPIQVSVV